LCISVVVVVGLRRVRLARRRVSVERKIWNLKRRNDMASRIGLSSGLVFVLGIATALGFSRVASAVVPTGIDTPSPNLPPAGVYLSPTDVHAMYTGQALSIVLHAIQHQPFTHGNPAAGVPDPVVTTNGANEMEAFDSQLTGLVSLNGGPEMPLTLMGMVDVTSFGKAGNVTGTYATEMTSMNLTGQIGGNPVMIRESPTLASTGQTSITDISGGNGTLFHINSFFDVFTELSVDGGNSWIPSAGFTEVNLVPLPEPASLTLLGLAGFGLMVRRRRVA
jgi:hypothetical protein